MTATTLERAPLTLVTGPYTIAPATTDQYVILATGSRSNRARHLISSELYKAVTDATSKNIVIRHGACPPNRHGDGADHIVSEWCLTEAGWFAENGITLTEDPMPADWDNCAPGCPTVKHRQPKNPGDTAHPGLLDDYCPGGGPRRNLAMVEKYPRPDICLGFPNGNSYGTKNCMKLAAAAGILVRRLA